MADITGFADFVDGVNVSLPEVNINTSSILSEMWKAMPPELLQKILFMLELGKWILIAILAYIIIKIIFQLLKIRDSANIAAIAINTKNISAKIDSLIHKKSEKKDEKKE